MTPKLLPLLLTGVLLAGPSYGQEEEPVVGAGKTIAFEYTLSLDDGSVVESNVGGQAFEYVHGESQILPALEEALGGLQVDEEATVTLPPEQAYGEVNAEAFQEVPIDRVPDDAREVGAELRAEGYGGPIRVHEVRPETVVLDFNHPLAGQELTFAVKVLSVD